jgi:hypothetical protein
MANASFSKLAADGRLGLSAKAREGDVERAWHECAATGDRRRRNSADAERGTRDRKPRR